MEKDRKKYKKNEAYTIVKDTIGHLLDLGINF